MDQEKLFKQKGISSKVVKISSGTKLWCCTIYGNLLLGSKAVYSLKSLKNLSQQEADEMRSWSGNHLVEIKINESISCIAYERKDGELVYYIHPSKFTIQNNKITVEKFLASNHLDIDTKLSNDAAFPAYKC